MKSWSGNVGSNEEIGGIGIIYGDNLEMLLFEHTFYDNYECCLKFSAKKIENLLLGCIFDIREIWPENWWS